MNFQFLKPIFLVFIICIYIPCQSQQLSTKQKKAQVLYYQAEQLMQARKFEDAIFALTESVKKDTQFWEAYLKLANIYRTLMLADMSKKYLQMACTIHHDSEEMSAPYFNLAEYYFKQHHFDSCSVWLSKAKKYNEDQRLNQKIDFLENCNLFSQKETLSKEEIVKVKLSHPINSFYTQSYPVLTAEGQKMIFTKRNGNKYTDSEDIMISKREKNGWSNPISISDSINSSLNEGVASISGDGKTMVFTACNRSECINKSCDIFISYKKGNAWSKPKNMGSLVNSDAWDSEPTLSADGRVIYFCSDRKNGFGKEDIWYSEKNMDGNWTKAKNIGSAINTSEREVSPFIFSDSKMLFYSCNHRVGLGGFDIFYTFKISDSTWTEPSNAGMGVNSKENDNSIFISSISDSIYHTVYDIKTGVENYPRSTIYATKIPSKLKKLLPKSYIYTGQVLDAESKAKIYATIELVDLNSQKILQQVFADPINGTYTLNISEGKNYALRVSADGYWFESKYLKEVSTDSNKICEVNFELKPIRMGTFALLDNIFFKTNEYVLDEQSRNELEALIKLLQKSPNINILITGHTDNDGSQAFNQKLSTLRAEEVKSYLQNHGIKKERIKARGMGNTRPIDTNTHEIGKAKNRRIEVSII